ncbi:hypothetical protein I3842_14G090800 [Carya illinoinensis]|uniref:Uncharacterized protein n=1 Tax=Carya illinoinensis TaxID=32201 RepID=A0A922AJ16_CARIL|nr:hypothetical protein I3842_14G090800 [Carya illinoinensis]
MIRFVLKGCLLGFLALTTLFFAQSLLFAPNGGKVQKLVYARDEEEFALAFPVGRLGQRKLLRQLERRRPPQPPPPPPKPPQGPGM